MRGSQQTKRKQKMKKTKKNEDLMYVVVKFGDGETLEFNYDWYGPKSMVDAYEWATETHEDSYVTSFKWHFC